jgi:prepilin-type N-terminal cleavage/methylation domain-containing protein
MSSVHRMDTPACAGPVQRPAGAMRRGMTLVELLVVVAVIAAMVALLLPAVQAAREVARRAACANNLRNIGCALHGHLLAKRTFPVGCLEWKSGTGGTKKCLAWSAYILPWLEEQSVADAIRFDLPYDDPANAVAGGTALRVYVCPSADRVGLTVGTLGRSDYGGIAGEAISIPIRSLKGALIHEARFTPRDIGDGLSKTLFVGECALGGWSDGQWINGRNLFEQAYSVNSRKALTITGVWFDDELRSRHPGGAFGLFGDGAVQFLPETTDVKVLAAVCTRADGEAATVP